MLPGFRVEVAGFEFTILRQTRLACFVHIKYFQRVHGLSVIHS